MRIRIKFTKNASVRYLGHLDIMRTFQRCFHRAGVRMTYSEGFNPHQKMSFAQPLGVGILSRGEYLDAEISDEQDPQKILTDLQAVTGDGFDILDVRILEENAAKAMASVRFAKYAVVWHGGQAPDPQKYLDQPVIMLQKKTKTGIREVDVKQSILSAERYEADKAEPNMSVQLQQCTSEQTDRDTPGQTLQMLMRAEGEYAIKPELVVQDMLAFENREYDRDQIVIIREELYSDNMIPLILFQTI